MHTLISIPPSHYVERARWALDLGSLPYLEQQWPPVLHFLGTYAAGAKRTVPALLLPSSATHPQRKRVLTDSSDILAYVNERLPAAWVLYPLDPAQRSEVQRIEQLCCCKLGRYTRVVVYSGLIPHSRELIEMMAGSHGMPRWRRALFRLFSKPIIALLHKAFVRNPAYVAATLAKMRAVFDEISALLAAKQQAPHDPAADIAVSISDTPLEQGKVKQQQQQQQHQQQQPQVHDGPVGLGARLKSSPVTYLVGDRFSAADLTFASLAAPVLFPPEYGAAMCDLKKLGPEFQTLVAELRATVAGQHALRMYQLHRGKAVLDGQPGATQQRDALLSKM
ncbi:MAG: hypothetical protein WDW36_002111 [Sanguina aurantia]